MTFRIVFTAILFIGAAVGAWIESDSDSTRKENMVLGAFVGFLVGGMVDFALAIIWFAM